MINPATADPPTVLVVDDVDDARELMAHVLGSAGFRVVDASSGLEAIRLAAAHVPAVILMDLFMPGLDGITASRQIKGNPDLRHIPIVAWTARPGPLVDHAGLFAGTIVKPCPPDRILALVRSLTDGSAASP